MFGLEEHFKYRNSFCNVKYLCQDKLCGGAIPTRKLLGMILFMILLGAVLRFAEIAAEFLFC